MRRRSLLGCFLYMEGIAIIDWEYKKKHVGQFSKSTWLAERVEREMWRRLGRHRRKGLGGESSASAGIKPPFAADARTSSIAKSQRLSKATTTEARFHAAADKIDIEVKKNTKITHCSHKMNVLRVECEAFCENILILLNGISCGAS